MDIRQLLSRIPSLRRDSSGRPFLWGAVAVLALLAMGAYYVRPWFHGIVITLYRYPLVLILLVLIMALVAVQAGLLVRAEQYRNRDMGAYTRIIRARKGLMSLVIIMGIAIVPLLLYSGYYVDRTLYTTTEYLQLETMPESDTIRFLPLSVATRYSLDAFTDPQFSLGDGDLVKEGGHLFWKFPIIPDGALLYYTKKPLGTISIAADTSSKRVTTSLEEMAVGEGIGIRDNIAWNIYKQDMFCDIGDIYYQDDLIIVSVIKYKFRLLGRYPVFGGVYTLTYDGDITYYTPEEAAQQSWGTRIYPESLARKQVEVVNTRNGLLNMWVYHKEMIEIQDVYSGGNRQPYLVDTELGLMWMTAVEPRGRSFGLYQIFFQDAATGAMYPYSVSASNLTGPRYSVDYVKKTFPNFDWYSFYMSEPRPVIKEGELYWLVSIVPNDSAGVTRQCVVNARTSDVTAFENDSEVWAFFEGSVPLPPGDETPTLDELKDTIAEIEALLNALKALVEELEADGA
jgi:hypothetical protein